MRQHAGLVVLGPLSGWGIWKIHALGLTFLILSVLPIRWFGRLERGDWGSTVFEPAVLDS